MIRLDIKPLSLNNAYVTNFKTGRRFPSKNLSQYKKDLAILIPKWKEVPEKPLAVKYIFGVSSKMVDGDNLVKAFQDMLGEVYGFNDRDIYKWVIEKKIVNKGQEYIEFEIETLKNN